MGVGAEKEAASVGSKTSEIGWLSLLQGNYLVLQSNYFDGKARRNGALLPWHRVRVVIPSLAGRKLPVFLTKQT